MSDPAQGDVLNALRHNPIGLCAACRQAHITGNTRGSRFYLCRLADRDPRFPKYPRLPVLRCSGFELAAPKTEQP